MKYLNGMLWYVWSALAGKPAMININSPRAADAKPMAAGEK
jgi:hypothetical protein